MGTSGASEPLNFCIIVIYELRPTYSFLPTFLTAPLEMVALTISRIYLRIYLIDITNIDKICDKVGQKFNFLCKLIGCEAQEGAE